ncbi:four-carbon acid sugar kinase family protein [Propioniciclava coleopterorum]|uniref:four-carbon acid sugar kinase family protein n=1 Tax=Propioniciclava coleopterorum TaxID=2714937 RepID=UPI001FEC45C0|nr:four-carbon acid sugar kinase family protein [Propioniciclava coleopterorum]
MPGADAAHLTAAAVAQLAGVPHGRLYLKVDSTLRGSVAAQVAGALAERRRTHPDAFAVVCPAYPAMGRTVSGGALLVDGVPVHETAAGTDPVTPVTTPRLADLVPGGITLPAPDTCADALAALDAHGEPGAVLCVDATTEQHLAALAAAVTGLGARAIPVGSAGLARHLASAWRAEPTRATPRAPLSGRRAVVVRSSANAASREQVARLLAAGPDPRVTVLEAPDRAGGDRDPVAVASELAGRVLTEVAAGADTLVLLGGDGAEAVLDRLGHTTLRVLGSVVEGVPLLQTTTPAPLTVATKAGGFGAADTLTAILEELLEEE